MSDEIWAAPGSADQAPASGVSTAALGLGVGAVAVSAAVTVLTFCTFGFTSIFLLIPVALSAVAGLVSAVALVGPDGSAGRMFARLGLALSVVSAVPPVLLLLFLGVLVAMSAQP